jgi:hypothetical protein
MGNTVASICARGWTFGYRFLRWLYDQEGEKKEGTKSETQGSLTLRDMHIRHLSFCRPFLRFINFLHPGIYCKTDVV